ncbi:sigma-70 family RNA polymerase sigma factor [Ruminococcaceae bacterium OttesenSCG-928-D13]|nr:sigma-70 family RNA polymerase sigma factor [Ruminococcaceae bacterium OttesenSCG-928-D13]
MKDKKLLALVKRASEKDQSAFETLCELKAREIIFLCTRELGNEHDGQDAAQEVFLKIQRYITNLKAPEAFNVWLNRIVVTTCSNMRRNNMRHKDALSIEDFNDTFVDESLGGLPQEFAEDADKRRRLVQLIDELPDKYRTCVLLHYYQNMSYDEIAQVLDVGRNTVDNNLRMARKILKLEFENAFGDEAKERGIPLVPVSAVLGATLIKAADVTVTPGLISSCLEAGGVYMAFTAGTTAAAGAATGFTAKVALQVAAAALAVSVTAGSVWYGITGGPNPSAGSGSAAGSNPTAAVSGQADPGAGSAVAPPVLSVGNGSISGTVVLDNSNVIDPNAYRGLDGLSMELVLASHPGVVLQTAETSGGPDGGRFEFTGLGAGRYKVRVQLPYGAKVLHDAGNFVVEDSAPETEIADPDSQSTGEAATDESGKGSTEPAENPAYYWLNLGGRTALEIGEDNPDSVTGLHLTLHLTTPVTGRLVRGDGSNYTQSGITIELWDPQGRLVAATKTKADGTYAFDDPMVSQNGTYALKMVPPEELGITFGSDTITVELTPGVGYAK